MIQCIGVVMARQLVRMAMCNVIVSLIAGLYCGSNIAFAVFNAYDHNCHGQVDGPSTGQPCVSNINLPDLEYAQYLLMVVFNMANLVALANSPRGQGGANAERTPLKLAVMFNILISVTSFFLVLVSFEMWGVVVQYLSYANGVTIVISGYEMMLIVARDGAPFLEFALSCVVDRTQAEIHESQTRQEDNQEDNEVRLKKENEARLNKTIKGTIKLYSPPALASGLRKRFPQSHYGVVITCWFCLRLTFLTNRCFLILSSISLFIFAVDNSLICEKEMAKAGPKMGEGVVGGFKMPQLHQLRRKANMSLVVSIMSAMYCCASTGYAINSFMQSKQTPTLPPDDVTCAQMAQWYTSGSPEGTNQDQSSNVVVFLVTFCFNIVTAMAVVSKPESCRPAEADPGHCETDTRSRKLMQFWMLGNILISFGWLACGLAGIWAVDLSWLLSLGTGFLTCWSFPVTIWNVQHFNEFVVIMPCVYYIILEVLSESHAHHYSLGSQVTHQRWAAHGRRFFIVILAALMIVKFIIDMFIGIAHPLYLTLSSILIFMFSMHNLMQLEEEISKLIKGARGWYHKLTLAKERARKESMLVILSIFAANYCATNLAIGVADQYIVPGTNQTAFEHTVFVEPLFQTPLPLPDLEILLALLFNVVSVVSLSLDPGHFAGFGDVKFLSDEGRPGMFMFAVFSLIFWASTNLLLSMSVDGADMVHVETSMLMNTLWIFCIWVYAWGARGTFFLKWTDPDLWALLIAFVAAYMTIGLRRALGIVMGYKLFSSSMDRFQREKKEGAEESQSSRALQG